MKKTISISIAGTLFWIEEDAFHTLEQYLKEIRAHFKDEPECDEIISDIEVRIAEQFIESRKKIITSMEIRAMIATMGNVGDFGDTGGQTAHPHESEKSSNQEKTEKRLFRNPDDKVIGGVASGLAAYLGIDVVWVRVVFLVLTFFNGLGFLAYLILWIATPEAKSASQRLEMSGTPVTLETISERIKERIEEVKKDEDGTLKKLARLPFEALRAIVLFLSKLIPFVRKTLGVLISVASGFALLGLSIALGFALLNFSQSFVDFPIDALIPTGVVVTFLFAVYFALFVPLLFISLLGSSLIAGRSTVRTGAAIGLLGLWFAALLSGGIIGANYGPRIASYVEEAPQYQKISRTVEVSPFSNITARNGVEISYTQGTSTSVSLSGRADTLERILVKNQDDTLVIEPNRESHRFCLFCDFGTPHVFITAPSIVEFEGENGVNFEGKNISSNGTTTISLSNGSRGLIEITGGNLLVDIKNGVYMELRGSTINTTLKGENGTRINAVEFTAQEANISIANASEVGIGETKLLNAKARNGAVIRYAGSPLVTKDARNGAEIENLNTE